MDKGELAEINSSGIWHCCAPVFFPDFFLGRVLAKEKQAFKTIKEQQSRQVKEESQLCFSSVIPGEREGGGCSGYFPGDGEFVGVETRHERFVVRHHITTSLRLSPGPHSPPHTETRQGDCAISLSTPTPPSFSSLLPPLSFLLPPPTSYNTMSCLLPAFYFPL